MLDHDEAGKSIRLGILSAGDPDDVRTWSGVPHFMTQALRKHFENVTYLPVFNSPFHERQRKLDRLLRRCTGNGFLPGRSLRQSKRYASRIDRLLMNTARSTISADWEPIVIPIFTITGPCRSMTFRAGHRVHRCRRRADTSLTLSLTGKSTRSAVTFSMTRCQVRLAGLIEPILISCTDMTRRRMHGSNSNHCPPDGHTSNRVPWCTMGKL